jgi:hypothetical protein
VTETVFDVVPEDPEEKRVAENVAPASVQKHGDEGREDVDGVVVDDARNSAPDGYRFTQWGHVRDLSRDHSEVAHAGGERLLIESGPLNENPRQEHRGQDGIGHPWRADSREFVAERNHDFSTVKFGSEAGIAKVSEVAKSSPRSSGRIWTEITWA